MNDHRHFHTESERRQLDGVLHDADANGWNISKHNLVQNISSFFVSIVFECSEKKIFKKKLR